jgi:drug/metabolite transporter (DMT)-like permease
VSATPPVTRRAHRRGVLLMIGATLCWSTAGMMVRNLDLRDGWEITFWRSLFMTVFILGVLGVQYRGEMFRRIRAVGWPGFIAGALWALMYTCFILALGLTTVANVLVIASITPFSAALLGRLFLGERVAGRTWVTMLAAFCGIVMMFMAAMERGGLIGNLIALVIPFAFAVNVVILRRMEAHVDMIPTLIVSGLLSMAIMLPLALPLTPTAKDLGLLAIMGVVQLGIGVLMMILATPALAAAEIGLLAVLETLFGTFFAWVVVGERPGANALLGGAVVVGALVVNELFALRERAQPPAGETASTRTADNKAVGRPS